MTKKLSDVMRKSKYLRTKLAKHYIVKQLANHISEIDRGTHFEYEFSGIRFMSIDELILNLETNG